MIWKCKIQILLGMSILGSVTVVNAVQQGTLILTNSIGVESALRLTTELDDGAIGQIKFKNTGKQLIMPSEDQDQWVPFSPGQRIEINTPVSISPELGGHGSVWGSLVKLYVLNRQTMHANLFFISKVAEYIVAKDAKNGLVLIGQEGMVYAK